MTTKQFPVIATKLIVAGGLGLAAVQLVAAAGAITAGTAGGPPKRHFLRSQGVREVHGVLCSRIILSVCFEDFRFSRFIVALRGPRQSATSCDPRARASYTVFKDFSVFRLHHCHPRPSVTCCGPRASVRYAVSRVLRLSVGKTLC